MYRLTSFGPNIDPWGTPDVQKNKHLFKVLPPVIYENLKASIHSPFSSVLVSTSTLGKHDFIWFRCLMRNVHQLVNEVIFLLF